VGAKSGFKKVGRRKAGTYGRTHGPKGSNFSQKRVANKAVRKVGYVDYRGRDNRAAELDLMESIKIGIPMSGVTVRTVIRSHR